jgi:hypothetical protein
MESFFVLFVFSSSNPVLHLENTHLKLFVDQEAPNHDICRILVAVLKTGHLSTSSVEYWHDIMVSKWMGY